MARNIAVKRVIKYTGYGAAFLFTLLLMLLIWLYTGPRSLPFLANYVSKQISDMLPETTNLYLQDIQLGFSDGYKLMFFLKEARFADNERGEFTFSEIKIGLDFLGIIPRSQHNLFNIQVAAPQFKLNEIAGRSVHDNLHPFVSINKYIQQHHGQLLKFSLNLYNTSFDVDLADGKVLTVNVNQFSLKPVMYKKQIIFQLFSDVNIGGDNNIINASIDTTSNDYLNVKGKITHITAETLKAVGYDLAALKHARIAGDLSFNATLKGLHNVDRIDFTFANLEGDIGKSAYFDADIIPQEIVLHGNCQNNCTRIEVENFAVKANQLNLSSHFIVSSEAGQQTIAGEFKVDRIPVQRIKDFWPILELPKTREWVFKNITKGTINSAVGKFNYDLGSTRSKKSSKTNFVQTDLVLEGVTMQYMEGVPTAHDIDAHVSIHNDDIKFTVSKAKISESDIIGAEGTIKNLSANQSPLSVSLQLKGPTQDIVDLGFIHADIKQHPYKELKGAASTNIKVSLPLQEAALTMDDIVIIADSTFSGFAGNKLYKDYSLSKGELKAQLRDKIISLNGRALLNNSVPVELSTSHNIVNDDRKIKIKSRLKWSDAAKLGFTKPDFINNFADLEMTLLEEGGAITKTITLDLTSSTIFLKSLGIMKKIGDPGMVKVVIDDSKIKTEITNYEIKVGILESSGQGSVSRDFSEIYSLNSSSTKIGASECNMSLKKANNQTHIHLHGDSLDLSSLSPVGNASSDFTSDILVTTKVNQILLKDAIVLKNPELEFECNKHRCDRIKLKGSYQGDGDLDLELNYPNLSITSDDAGKTIKAFGLSQKIDSGTLDVQGKYNKGILTGVVEMEKFRLHKAPILAKIMSMTSLTVAIFDSLGNIAGQRGIGFDKADCPFSYDGSVIKMSECEAAGPSLIISGSGTINVEKDMININGTVAAPNIIDSTLGRIPLIGKAITGSDDKGFIGANFSVEGSMDDAKVSANPLSILTPGIFRQIFSPSKKE